MQMQYSQAFLSRFWSKVQRTDTCWLRGGTTDRYAKLREAGKGSRTLQAHRVSWEIAYGPIPDGLFVLHTCDVKRCVRPSHLFLGSQADNMADKVAKGRQARGATHASHLYPEKFLGGTPPRFRGERHPQAKLTAAQVETIRLRHAAEGIGSRRLGRAYGVNRTTIQRILNGDTWQ